MPFTPDPFDFALISSFYQEAERIWTARASSIIVKGRQNFRLVLGQRVDARARFRLRAWARSQGLGLKQANSQGRPVGTSEGSPAIYRWVWAPNRRPSPVGTADFE